MGASQSQQGEDNGQQQHYRSDAEVTEKWDANLSDVRATVATDRRVKEAHNQQQISEGRAKGAVRRMDESPYRGNIATASVVKRDERRKGALQPQLVPSEGKAKAGVRWMEEAPSRGYATATAVERDERRKDAQQPQLVPSEGKAKAGVRRMEEAPSRGYATASATEREERKLPVNVEAILREADTPVDRSSPEKLIAQLYSGVLLNQKRKKYWLDKKSNKNCFMVFARDLQITWAEDIRYWEWKPQQDTTSDVIIDAAELLNVCWLEVHGRLDTRKLSPETLYEVVFVVMMKEVAYGWEAPVSLRLTLPNGIKHEHKVNLMEQPRGQWMEIPVGEFKTVATNAGEIEFSLYEYECGDWKRGLVIKGAAIRPKN